MTMPNGSGTLPLEESEAHRRASSSTTAGNGDDDQAAIVSLVDRAKEGDAEAFGALYDRFLPEIVRYLTHRTGNGETAEDLAQ